MVANRLPLLFALLLFAARPAAAESDANFHADPNSFTLSVKNEVLGEQVVYYRAFLSAGTNQMTFVVPREFRIETATGRQLSIGNSSNDCLILVRFLGPQDVEQGGSSLEDCRQLMLKDHPGASIAGEFTRPVAGFDSWGFELDWSTRGRADQKVCAVAVPSPAGLWVFELIAAPKDFQERFYNYNFLLLTTVAGSNGRLEYSPLSDKL